MSEFIGEAFVAIRPDASTFRVEAEQQIDRALTGVKATPRESLLGLAQQSREIRFAESAREVNELEQAFQRLEEAGVDSQENIAREAARVREQLAAQGVAVGNIVTDAARQSAQIRDRLRSDTRAIAETAAISNRDALLGMVQSSRELRFAESADEVDALRAAFDDLEARGVASQENIAAEAARVRAELAGQADEAARVGRTATSGFGGAAIRAGLLGAAVTAGVQAVGHLQDALRTTGEEAFTTGGRIRNAFSELLDLDVVGALKGLTNQPSSLAELGIDATEAAVRLDEFREAAARAGEEGDRELRRFGPLGRAAAFGVNELENAFNQSADEAHRLYEEARAAAEPVFELAAASRELLRDALRLRTAGGQPLGPSLFGAPAPFTLPRQPPAFATVPNAPLAREVELAAAQRAGNLQEQLRIAQENLQVAINRVNIVQAGNTRLYNERIREEIAARNAVDSINDQIRAQNEAAAAAAAAERERLAAAAAAAAAEAQAAGQLELANNEAKAALTKRKTDDIAAIRATIDYFKDLVAATEGLERAQARQALIAARGRLAEVLKPGKPVESDERAIDELRLQNRRARAQLTKRLDDDKAAIRAQIEYYRQLVKNSEGLEREQARAKLIASQLALRQLDEAKKATTEGTTAFDLLQQAARTFAQSAGNVVGADQPFRDETAFTADLAQWLRRMDSPASTAAAGRFPMRFELNDDRIVRQLERIADNTAPRDGRTRTTVVSGALDRNDRRFQEAREARDAVGAIG